MAQAIGHSSDPGNAPLIARQSLPEMISDALVERMKSGSLAEGDLLREGELTQEFRVGRSSVRTALQYLQHAGLVVVARGKGWKVRGRPVRIDEEYADWTHGDYAHLSSKLLEVRLGIEPVALSLAASRASTAQIARMQDLSEAYAGADGRDIEQLIYADEAFHASLIDGADNEVLSRLYQTLTKDIRNFRRRSYGGEGVHKRSSEEHQQIVDAVRRRESAIAAAAARSHISNLYIEVRQLDPDARNEHISIFAG
jgi:DNA-binding FadR family transcriptional regulator